MDFIYVLTLKTTCNMLSTYFGEHYRRIKMPKQFDTFLYQHFKCTGYSSNDISVQPVEKISYQNNSFPIFKIIKRHEMELKWIKFLQTSFPLGFNDNIYHERNISKMAYLDVFSFWNFGKVNLGLMASDKMGIRNEKCALLKELLLH